MSFFDEYEDRVIMREFLDDADFYEEGDLEDAAVLLLKRVNTRSFSRAPTGKRTALTFSAVTAAAGI